MGEDSATGQVIGHKELWGDCALRESRDQQTENRTKDIFSINHGTEDRALLCTHLIKAAHLPSKAANS